MCLVEHSKGDVVAQRKIRTIPRVRRALYPEGWPHTMQAALYYLRRGRLERAAPPPPPYDHGLYVNGEFAGLIAPNTPPTSHALASPIVATGQFAYGVTHPDGYQTIFFDTTATTGQAIIAYDLLVNNPTLEVHREYSLVMYGFKNDNTPNVSLPAAVGLDTLSNVQLIDSDVSLDYGEVGKPLIVHFAILDAVWTARYIFGLGIGGVREDDLYLGGPVLMKLPEFPQVGEGINDHVYEGGAGLWVQGPSHTLPGSVDFRVTFMVFVRSHNQTNRGLFGRTSDFGGLAAVDEWNIRIGTDDRVHFSIRDADAANAIVSVDVPMPAGCWAQITAEYTGGQMSLQFDSETPVTAAVTNRYAILTALQYSVLGDAVANYCPNVQISSIILDSGTATDYLWPCEEGYGLRMKDYVAQDLDGITNGVISSVNIHAMRELDVEHFTTEFTSEFK